MAEKKKFLVGKGKKIRGRTGGGSSGSPLTGSAANGSQPLPPSGAPRRFLVGEGKKVERAPPPPRSHAYGVPIRPTGCICAHPERTGHVPFCPFFTTALYVCEEADRKTVVQLAHVAGESIQALERRRCFMPREDCPDVVREKDGDPRRRCWWCPYWKKSGDTPILLSYEEVHDGTQAQWGAQQAPE